MKCRLVLAVLCCIAVGASVASAGPLRDWINSKRPGVLIPLPYQSFPVPRPAHAPPVCPCPVCPCPSPTTQPAPCPGGVCPLPNPSHTILPVGVPVVTLTPQT